MIRKTLTILFADVEGYTTRTGRHTRKEHEQFIIELQTLIKQQTREHNGRLVKTMGDGFMLTFDSPTDAVGCGMSIQKQIFLKNSTVYENKNKISFRIGINTGEVMADESGDVYGEAVNIAARIEKFSQSDQVYISDATYLSMNKSEFKAVDLGLQKFKNLAQQVRVYRVVEGDIDLVANLQRPLGKNHIIGFLKISAVIAAAALIFFLINRYNPGAFSDNNADIYSRLEQLMIKEDFQGIIDTINKALKKDPQRGDLYSFLGEAFLKLKRYKRAELYLKKAVNFDQDNPGPYNMLSILYAEKKNFNQAIMYLAEYMTKDITSIEKKASINRMKQLEQLKKERFSTNSHTGTTNLLVLSTADQTNQSSFQPDQPQSGIVQKVYFSSEDEAIDTAKFEPPEDQTALQKPAKQRIQELKEKVQSLMQNNEFQPVRHLLEKAEENLSQNPKFLIFSGRIYSRMKDYGKAEQMLLKATDLDPNNPIAYSELAKLYKKANNYQASIEMLEKFILKVRDPNRRIQAQNRLEFLKAQLK